MSKNLSFVTIHIGSNFGSNLQAIATSEVLKKLGYNPICINYIPPRTTWKRYWQDCRGSYKRLLRRALYFPLSVLEKRRFSKFLSKYCLVSTPIYSEDDFSVKCPKADYYLTGSDQVWNFVHNEGLDLHYFFDGITGKKVAYASSIGMSDLSDKEKDLLKKYTADYCGISVREKSAVILFEQIGRKVEQLIDPTMMLNYKEWERFAKPRIINAPYLFVYLPYNIEDEELCYRTIKKIAEAKNLKIVSSSFNYMKDVHADKTVLFADPGDFLSLMIHASYVVTNSFHGTAFSMNLHKDFYVYMPSKFSTRITSILGMCGLNDRLLTREIDEKQLNSFIDYQPIEKILVEERNKAICFLKGTLA